MYLSNPVLLVVVTDHLPPSNNHHHHFRIDSNNFKVESRLAASPLSPSSSSSTSPGSLSRTSSLTDMSGEGSASFPFQPAALSQLDQSLPMANSTWDVECDNWSLHLPFFIIVTLYMFNLLILKSFLRYLLTPYLVVIWACNGIRAKKMTDPMVRLTKKKNQTKSMA